jgi:ATP-dependent RNA helicase RhlE
MKKEEIKKEKTIKKEIKKEEIKKEKTIKKEIKKEEIKKEEKNFVLEGSFSDLNVGKSLVKILDDLKLTKPTPIQRKAIPPALAGKDLIGVAQTGTGKTLAFAVPMIQKIEEDKSQGLVVAPTRELAYQVADSFKEIGKTFGLRVVVLIGGEKIGKQFYALRRRPHVIVATPGRLIDHIHRKSVDLNNIKTLVLDEADMMLDLGFAPQIEEILIKLPKERQTMLFSATMPKKIAELASRHLKFPISIEVSPQGTSAEGVDPEVIVVQGSDRFTYLKRIVDEHKGSILIFVRTKHGVANLTRKLVDFDYKATEIHSNLSLYRRKKSLENFKSQKARILVATDVAARGLDVNGIELVVNYNLPDCSSDYVHRIGRTGRAGKKGKAISIATSDQFMDIKGIERLINKELPITEYTELKRDNFKKKRGNGRRSSNTYRGGRKDFRSKRTSFSSGSSRFSDRDKPGEGKSEDRKFSGSQGNSAKTAGSRRSISSGKGNSVRRDFRDKKTSFGGGNSSFDRGSKDSSFDRGSKDSSSSRERRSFSSDNRSERKFSDNRSTSKFSSRDGQNENRSEGRSEGKRFSGSRGSSFKKEGSREGAGSNRDNGARRITDREGGARRSTGGRDGGVKRDFRDIKTSFSGGKGRFDRGSKDSSFDRGSRDSSSSHDKRSFSSDSRGAKKTGSRTNKSTTFSKGKSSSFTKLKGARKYKSKR